MYWEVPLIIQRLCGICPVSHHLAAAKAMDMVVGVDKLTPTAEKMRRLMHYGQVLQSNALHIFHLASPDLLFGFDAPPEQRNIIAVLNRFPEIGKWAIFIRKYGQEVIKATGGRKIHPTSAVPGGINQNLSIEDRDTLREAEPTRSSLGPARPWSTTRALSRGTKPCIATLRAIGRISSALSRRTAGWIFTTAACAPSRPMGRRSSIR